jgi:hypothetical protein
LRADVASLEADTNAFDVGAEPRVDVLDEADADVRDVDVVREVELTVELVDDCDWDVVAAEDPEPAV